MTNDAGTAATETETGIPEAVDAGPFTMDLTKDQMVEHLVTAHAMQGIYARTAGRGVGFHRLTQGTKLTKQQLFSAHKNQHRAMAELTAEHWSYKAGTHFQIGVPTVKSSDPNTTVTDVVHVYVPQVNHTHPAIVPGSGDDGKPTETQESLAKRIMAGDLPEKPLSVTERRVVSQLIDNEFGQLEQSIREMASDSLAARSDELKTEWAERKAEAPVFVEKARKIARKAEKKLDALVKDAKSQGITLSGIGLTRYFSPTVEHDGYKAAVAEIRAENAQMLSRALMTLERQRLTAQTKVLMAGLTPEGAKLLDGIPTAKDLMLEAHSEAGSSPKEITS